MRNKFDFLFFFGKALYYLGIFLLINLVFGWFFLRFFFWLIFGVILLVLFLVASAMGKKILGKIFFRAPKEKNYHRASRPQGKVIDVEARVIDEDADPEN